MEGHSMAKKNKKTKTKTPKNPFTEGQSVRYTNTKGEKKRGKVVSAEYKYSNPAGEMAWVARVKPKDYTRGRLGTISLNSHKWNEDKNRWEPMA